MRRVDSSLGDEAALAANVYGQAFWGSLRALGAAFEMAWRCIDGWSSLEVWVCNKYTL